MKLIDGDELIELLLSTAITDKQREYSECVQYAVQKMPTVDAVPVRHGRWEHHPEIGWGSTWLCSECGEKTVETVMGEPRYKFCPMCGADLRKDGGNETD